jgi:hypothetical protein
LTSGPHLFLRTLIITDFGPALNVSEVQFFRLNFSSLLLMIDL